jgi:hypothetical protein
MKNTDMKNITKNKIGIIIPKLAKYTRSTQKIVENKAISKKHTKLVYQLIQHKQDDE